jgi:GT2 family glycosyltransferase
LGITDILRKVLFFLNFQTSKEFEVIVVNTNSNNLNSELKSKLNSDYKLNYVINVINLDGGTKALARNVGVLNSKTDYILFIDSDMIPHPNLVEEHLKTLRQNNSLAVVGLEMRTLSLEEYDNTLKILDNISKNTSSLKFELEKVFSLSYSNYSRKVRKKRFIDWFKFLTGNLSTYREAIIKASLFDLSFVSYGFEDLELGYRYSKMGYKILFNPKAMTLHLHPLTLQKRLSNKIESIKNLKIFYNKYGNKEILNKLGINFYSRIVYGFLPLFSFLAKLSDDYYVNYHFWNEWNKYEIQKIN